MIKINKKLQLNVIKNLNLIIINKKKKLTFKEINENKINEIILGEV